MQIPDHYNVATYHLPKEFIREISKLDPGRSNRALLFIWSELLFLLWTVKYQIPVSLFWIFYFPAIFLIAGRYGALLQLVHEASHELLSYSRSRNLFLARWFCAYPLGVFLEGYIAGHLRHHAGTGTANDPISDTEKYRIVDFHDPKIYLAFLKDLLGITALSIFFKYKEGDEKAQASYKKSNLKPLFQLSFVQLVILGLLFQFDIQAYLLLWIVPAISPHMFLMRIRGIAEHGLPKQIGFDVKKGWEGNFFTRSFMTDFRHYRFMPFVWLERILIGSLNVNHHHEHHLYPIVPFYNLPELHRRLAPEIAKRNPEVYSSGYFAAAFFSLLKKNRGFSLADSGRCTGKYL